VRGGPKQQSVDDAGVGRPAARDELRGAHVDVKADLVVHLAGGAVGPPDGEPEETTDARPDHGLVFVRRNAGTSGRP
jgi:hypothetical protein